MLLSTSEKIAGRQISETLGIARGSTIQARHLGRDILAGLKMLAGGEIKSYTEMMTRAREESLLRMEEAAKKMGADAVVGVRFASVMIMAGTAECLAYGTAVKLGVEQTQ